MFPEYTMTPGSENSIIVTVMYAINPNEKTVVHYEVDEAELTQHKVTERKISKILLH